MGHHPKKQCPERIRALNFGKRTKKGPRLALNLKAAKEALGGSRGIHPLEAYLVRAGRNSLQTQPSTKFTTGYRFAI
jgi:hypothetical protein